MGKNKAQRTKNNAKPSNSSRSAEFLGSSMPTFVGFSAVKDGGYVPVLPGLTISALSDVESNTIDSNFQLVFKKMNKKDATTKFKALQEFSELCKNSDLPAVEAVLPFWPRLYSHLCIDEQHRVREAAQLAHAALVKRVGRNIATYLKQLAGPWFTSQFDTYPPAASAATNSFQETFPQKKIVDAIVHLQEEILFYISDTIRVQTPQSMTTNKNLTTEELETKYQRILLSCLQAYSSYLKKVPSCQLEKTLKSHQEIISSAKFWKLAKHESVLIKTAFFNVLASLVQHATDLMKEEKKRAMTAIMNSLDETEPSLLLAVWESMLVAINKIDDWHSSVSIEKLVLPKLWRVLRSGGQCCASVVYPNLLPFISQFPKFNLDHKPLFVNFFTQMRQGFVIKSVQISRSEIFAVTKSFFECLRYVILLYKNDEEFCVELLKSQLSPVISFSLTEAGASRLTIFCELTQLVRYWSKNRVNAEYSTYTKLMEIFWQELELTFTNLLTNSSERTCAIYDSQIQLLCNLKNGSSLNRKNLRVKFSDVPEARDADNDEKYQTRIVDTDEDSAFIEEIDNFVNNLCIVYLKKNILDSSSKNVEFLNRFLSNFESEQLFVGIAKAYRDDADLYEFYDKVLKSWLVEKTDNSSTIVQLILTSLRYMDNAKKENTLKSLMELDDTSILKSAIICALSDEKIRNDIVVRTWFCEPRITEKLTELAENLGNCEDPENIDDEDVKILSLAFESRHDGEFYVSQEAVSSVGSILSDRIMQENSTNPQKIVELVSKLLELSYRHKIFTNGSLKMLKSLFELSLRDPLNFTEVSYHEVVRNIWKSGFARCTEKLEPDRLQKLHEECMDIIYKKMYNTNDSQVEDVIVDYTIDFIGASNKFDPIDSLQSAIEFNTRDKILIDEWIPRSLRLVLNAEVLRGRFYLSNPIRSVPNDREIEFFLPQDEILPDQTENCLKWASFNAKLLNKLIGGLENDTSDEADSALPYILNYILLITSIGQIYSFHFKSAKNYEKIEAVLNNLLTECANLRTCVEKDIWDRIVTDSLSEETSWIEHGSLFSQFLSLFYGSDKHLSEVQSLGPKILTDYVESNDDSSLSRDMNAVILARCILDGEKNTDVCIRVLEKLIRRYQAESSFPFLHTDEIAAEWSDLVLPFEIIRLFTKLVKVSPQRLSSELWDVATIYLASWTLAVAKSKSRHEDFKTRTLTIVVNEFYYEIQSLLVQNEKEAVVGLSDSLIDIWKNVFADDVHCGIASAWMFYAEFYNKKSDSLLPGIVLDCLGRAVSIIDGRTFFKKHDGDFSQKITSERIIKLALELLSSPVSSLQLSAHHVLNQIIPILVEQDKALVESDNYEPKDLNVRKFEEVLANTQKIVNTMLMGFKLCDTTSCSIQPYTDSYTYSLGYLLAWANVLNMCANAHADVRYQYAEFVKDDYFPFLLNNIFKLMPVEILQDSKSKSSKFTEIFSTQPSLQFGEFWNEWRLDHIVCWLFTNSMRQLPVLVRQWWSTADSRISAAVEKITILYVSPILCREELMNNRLSNIENMEIKVHPSAREVVALYQMDDTKLELSMVLPVNHPLDPVTVEPGQHAGGAANWRNCHMQLSIFLTHQNGSIWDGLLMWKKNLDKKFSGVEECFICYSIFHINTYQIPKLSCHTCRKKFHAPCLYKWFTTSQKSTCPICRNIF